MGLSGFDLLLIMSLLTAWHYWDLLMLWIPDRISSISLGSVYMLSDGSCWVFSLSLMFFIDFFDLVSICGLLGRSTCFESVNLKSKELSFLFMSC